MIDQHLLDSLVLVHVLSKRVTLLGVQGRASSKRTSHVQVPDTSTLKPLWRARKDCLHTIPPLIIPIYLFTGKLQAMSRFSRQVRHGLHLQIIKHPPRLLNLNHVPPLLNSHYHSPHPRSAPPYDTYCSSDKEPHLNY